VAISFAVLDRTHSPSALGLVGAANAAPLVLLVLIGGVVGDRIRRGPILVGSNVALGAARGGFAALVLAGAGGTWDLAACAAAGSVANAFFLPASSAVIPEIVPPSQLRQANALLRLTGNGTQIVGAALGGIAVAAIGPGWALAWDAASFMVAAALFTGLPKATVAVTGGPRPGIWSDLRLGWGEFWARPWLWSIVLQFAAVNAAFSAGFRLLGPVVTARWLGGAAAWGAILSALATGYVAGGFVALRWKPARPLLIGTFGVFTMAVPLAALALHEPVVVEVAAAFVAGVGLEQFGVGWATVMQEQIPLDCLSRVTSYDMLGSYVFIPVGYAVGGPVSSAVGVNQTVWACAAIVIVATVAVLFCREVRTMTRKAPQPLEPELKKPTSG